MAGPFDLLDADVAPAPAPAPAPGPAGTAAPSQNPFADLDRDVGVLHGPTAAGSLAPGVPALVPGKTGADWFGEQAKGYAMALPVGLAEGGEDLAHAADVIGNKIGLVSDDKLQDVEQQQQELERGARPYLDPVHGIPLPGGPPVGSAQDVADLGRTAVNVLPAAVPVVGPELVAGAGAAQGARNAQLQGGDPAEQVEAALASAITNELGFRGVPILPELGAAGRAQGGLPGLVAERAAPGAAQGALQVAGQPQGQQDLGDIGRMALLSLMAHGAGGAARPGEAQAAPADAREAAPQAVAAPAPQVDPSAVTREVDPAEVRAAAGEQEDPAGKPVQPADVEIARAQLEQDQHLRDQARLEEDSTLDRAVQGEQVRQEADEQEATAQAGRDRELEGINRDVQRTQREQSNRQLAEDDAAHARRQAVSEDVDDAIRSQIADHQAERDRLSSGSQAAAMTAEARSRGLRGSFVPDEGGQFRYDPEGTGEVTAPPPSPRVQELDSRISELQAALDRPRRAPSPTTQELGHAETPEEAPDPARAPEGRAAREDAPQGEGQAPDGTPGRVGDGAAPEGEGSHAAPPGEEGLAHVDGEQRVAARPGMPGPPRSRAEDKLRTGGFREREDPEAAAERQRAAEAPTERIVRPGVKPRPGEAPPAPEEAPDRRTLGYGSDRPGRPSDGIRDTKQVDPETKPADGETAPPARETPAPSPAAEALWGEKSVAGSFARQDVAPAIAEAAKTVREARDDIRATFAPQTAGDQARTMAGLAREHGAELAQRSDRAVAALKQAHNALQARSWDENLDFMDRMERGQRQPTPDLQAIADQLRDVLDSRTKEIQRDTGKLEHFIEDYFPHIWKDPEKAESLFSQILGKRPLEGSKSFLKKRTIPTIRDGIEAGLEPVSRNPVDLVLLKAREMDKFLLGQRLLSDMKARNLAKYVSVNDKAPEGYAKIDDKIATVYGPPTVTVREFVDQQTYQALSTAIDKLGIRHDRLASAGRGALGFSEQGNSRIVTRGASDPIVIAHELGHQLDVKLGLGKLLNVPELKKETGAIADLHGGKKAYFRKPEERVASVVEAYVRARERLQELAPKTFKVMNDFVDAHPELASLKHVKPSLQLQELEFEQAHGGLLKMGEHWAPQQAADVINNYLSPGLRGSSGAFRAYLGAANVLNQLQLGMSAFHLGFTSLDAATSRFAIGLNHLAEGNLATGLAKLASTPTAPLTNLLQGNKILKEWFKPGSQGGDIAAIVDSLRAAGGRAKMDGFYQTTHFQRMMDAFRAGNVIGGILRLPLGTIDALAKPIMEYIVPRQKLGVFADMARLELGRLPSGASRDQVREAMGRAWDSVDNRMGQLVYDNLFWKKSVKDLSMASVRSLGWNLGTIRELGGGALDYVKQGGKLALGKKPELTYRMAYMAALPVVTGALGASLTYLMTGKGPQSLKDYFFPDTGRKDANGDAIRISLPSYMKDLYEYAHAPVDTLTGKLHPALGALAQMFENKDYYGTEIRHPDDPLVKQALQVAEYLGTQLEPFGVRNAQQQAHDHTPTSLKAAGFVGFPSAPHWIQQSKAEQLAGELARNRMPQGSRTQEQATKAQTSHDLIARLRDPDPETRKEAIADFNRMVSDGEISKREAHNIHARSTTTQLDYEVKEAPLDDAMRIWRVSTPDERKELKPLIGKKLQDAAKSSSIPYGTRKQYYQEIQR
jgi:hypothetical protein